jgi:DNA-binding MarR family transcriptional regulator
MNEQTELLREIRDLLLLIAEPALAKRDEIRRNALKQIAGSRGKAKAKAILLMDGTRNRATIQNESGIDQGDLSRLIKALKDQGLITTDQQPKLVITIPFNFFENSEN